MVRLLAILVGVFIFAVGIVLVATPSGFIAAAQPLATPAGLYVAAVVRIVVGVILMTASRLSRAPAVLRVLGAIVVIAGVTTPFVGSDRAIAILDAWASRGPTLMRATGGIMVMLGVSIAYMVTQPRARQT